MTIDNESDATIDAGDPGYRLVTIPSHLLEQVLAYLKELTGDDDEVIGLMLRPVGGGLPGHGGGTGPTFPVPPKHPDPPAQV